MTKEKFRQSNQLSFKKKLTTTTLTQLQGGVKCGYYNYCGHSGTTVRAHHHKSQLCHPTSWGKRMRRADASLPLFDLVHHDSDTPKAPGDSEGNRHHRHHQSPTHTQSPEYICCACLTEVVGHTQAEGVVYPLWDLCTRNLQSRTQHASQHEPKLLNLKKCPCVCVEF